MRSDNLITTFLGWLGMIGLLLGAACTDNKPEEEDWELKSHYQKGNLALGDGNLETAESEFRQVLELDDEHVAALNKLARVLLKKAEKNKNKILVNEAIVLLKKSTSMEPKRKLGWRALAGALKQANRLDEASEAYQKLIEFNDADFASRLAIAELHEAKGEHDKADNQYATSLAKYPEAGLLLLAHGRFLLKRKKADQAQKAFMKIKKTSVEYYEALDELGALAAVEGKLDEVRRIYQTMVAIHPQDYMVWELLAAIDEREKKFVDAEEKYRRSLEVDREHISAWIGLGRVLLAQEKRDQAIYAFRKADGFLGRDPVRTLELVDELVGLGDKSWARSVLERAKIATDDQRVIKIIEKRLASLDSDKPEKSPAEGSHKKDK
ncbi:MAG: tetratricopeptide repeat protein [Deltaproteobacteria bacterium]|nr:tetratricopeptide repeat protein [Deltaproteobacteria bacterium]